jgi:antitoxin component YwqK of YwqJK toxin-antitoxin module
MNPEITYYENGIKRYEGWFLNNNYHREDGPAFQSWFSNGNKSYEGWYLNGILHRENAPAFIYYNQDGTIKESRWYLNGKNLSLKDIRKLKLERI